MNKVLCTLFLSYIFIGCTNPAKSIEDEIKSGFQFDNNISDTTYVVYNDGEVIIESSSNRDSNDNKIKINTSIIAKQRTDDIDSFYYYLNGCKTIYSISEDTVFIYNQYSYNPDGGNPDFSSIIEIDPPANQTILIQKIVI